MDNKRKSFLAAFFSGIILIISGISGESKWIIIKEVVELFVQNTYLEFVFFALIIIGSLGGFAVIIGGVLIFGGINKVGRLVIFLGTGLGIVGILISFALWFIGGLSPISIGFGLAVVGVGLSMHARSLARDG